MADSTNTKKTMIALPMNTLLLPGETFSITLDPAGYFKHPEDFSRFVSAVEQEQNGEMLVIPDFNGQRSTVGTLAKVVGAKIKDDNTLYLRVNGLSKHRVLETHIDKRNFHIAQTEPMPPTASRAEKKRVHLFVDAFRRKTTEYIDFLPETDNAQKAQMRPYLEKILADREGGAAATVTRLIYCLVLFKVATEQEMIPIYEMDNPVKQIEALVDFVAKKNLATSAKTAYRKSAERALTTTTATPAAPPAAKKKPAAKADPDEEELAELEKAIAAAPLPAEARQRAEKEFKKFKAMCPTSSEAAVIRNYLDWITSLPWGTRKKVNDDIPLAAEVLESDHYGLEKVKRRILSHLAVQKRLKEKSHESGEIICLLGPPGVGKTSIAKSIATATNRDYIRISLGGVRDEAEIRGHRRTYIGAMPGRVIAAFKKIGSSNPVFVLDEIDKMAQDQRGDPASALLEVLDPEQNRAFHDHYLDLDYDLSSAMFILTANSLSGIPGPLRDRMEIIEIEGYTAAEKLEIAQRHLLAQASKKTGLGTGEISISADVVRAVIDDYTSEAGVRGLKRELVGIHRNVAVELETNPGRVNVEVTSKNLIDYAGKPKVFAQRIHDQDQTGYVVGLAWTANGGVILPIEVTAYPAEKFEVIATGKLGEVMGESIHVAQSMILSKAEALGIKPERLKKIKIHVHAPAGAVPKDGPSAGVTVSTALVSLLLDEPVRRDVAMTGEITLRGEVWPIGGMAAKMEGALRAGVTKVLVPQENYDRDLDDVPASVREALEIVPVRRIEDVFRHALVNGQKLFPEEKMEKTTVVSFAPAQSPAARAFSRRR